LKATIAICTFNGAARITEVLSALGQQTLNRSEWEILIIDNASSDGTGEVVTRFISGESGLNGRVVREERPGLSFARAKAAREAFGEIVCFLDDDNIPAPDFAECVVRAFANRPSVGAMGGKVLAVWETPPSPLALAVQNFALAICDSGEKPFRYQPEVGPVGAGLCIRSKVLQAIYAHDDAGVLRVGHRGKSVGGGDDLAIGLLTWRLGYECWYEPSLVIQHKLPPRRMEKEYLLKLYEAIGRGQAEVRKLYDWKARTPLNFLIGLKDFCRWQLGKWCGPSAQLRRQWPEIAGDLHDLSQQLLWGRSLQALSSLWP